MLMFDDEDKMTMTTIRCSTDCPVMLETVLSTFLCSQTPDH